MALVTTRHGALWPVSISCGGGADRPLSRVISPAKNRRATRTGDPLAEAVWRVLTSIVASSCYRKFYRGDSLLRRERASNATLCGAREHLGLQTALDANGTSTRFVLARARVDSCSRRS